VMLCMVLAPAILLTAWLSARPTSALVGAGLGIAYFLMIGFNQALGDNPVRYFNDSIALMIALAVSAMMFSLTDYAASPWARRRIERQLRGLVVEACQDAGMTASVFEARARDLVQRSGDLHRPQVVDSVGVVEALCATLEIGHAVIALRTGAEPLTTQARRLLQHTLLLIAHSYKQPGAKNRQQLLQWLDHFLAWLQGGEYAQALSPAQLQTLITQLHFIRLVVASDAPGHQASTRAQEVQHAA
jgi:uncharacterized membrane protein YccC